MTKCGILEASPVQHGVNRRCLSATGLQDVNRRSMKHLSAIIVAYLVSRTARNQFQAPEIPTSLASAMPIFFIQKFAAWAALATKTMVPLWSPSQNPVHSFASTAIPIVPIRIALCANLVIPILLSVVRTYIAHNEHELFRCEQAHHIGT